MPNHNPRLSLTQDTWYYTQPFTNGRHYLNWAKFHSIVAWSAPQIQPYVYSSSPLKAPPPFTQAQVKSIEVIFNSTLPLSTTFSHHIALLTLRHRTKMEDRVWQGK